MSLQAFPVGVKPTAQANAVYDRSNRERPAEQKIAGRPHQLRMILFRCMLYAVKINVIYFKFTIFLSHLIFFVLMHTPIAAYANTVYSHDELIIKSTSNRRFATFGNKKCPGEVWKVRETNPKKFPFA